MKKSRIVHEPAHSGEEFDEEDFKRILANISEPIEEEPKNIQEDIYSDEYWENHKVQENIQKIFYTKHGKKVMKKLYKKR